MSDRVGQQLGNYKILKLLGRGGFAEVYLSEHIYLKTSSAIKVLQTHLSGPDDLQSFLREAQTIAHLQHPYIIRVTDFGVHSGTPYLVMDYAPNGTLRQRHPRGTRVPLPTIISYVKQIADALQYAHDKRLIHRDIKPENMLINGSNNLWLSDFGIALIAQSSHHQSKQDVTGTVAYMSPEQIQGRPRPASDQYSLGIVVYEWLSGDQPFHGSLAELCTQQMFAPLPSLREKVPDLPNQVEQVIAIALSKDFKERFSNIRAFANALEQASQAGAPIQTEDHSALAAAYIPHRTKVTSAQSSIANPYEIDTVPVQPPEAPLYPTEQSSVKKIFSRRGVLIGGAITGLLMVISGGWVLFSQKGASSEGDRSPIPSTPSPVTLHTALHMYQGRSGPISSVTWSPSREFFASAGYDGTVKVWSAINGGEAIMTLARSPSTPDTHIWSVDWSPKDIYVAAGSSDLTLTIWDTHEQKSVHTILTKGPDEVTAVAWSPDGTRVASGSGNGDDQHTVQVWDAFVKNMPVVTHSGYADRVTSVAWSPDGARIVAGGFDGTVRVWDAMNKGNPFLTYHEHSAPVNTVAWSPDGRYITSGSDDRTVIVRDLTGKTTPIVYRRHSDNVTTVAWSRNSRYVASGSWDATVQVWEAATGTLVMTYKGHSDHVYTVAWSPDSTRLASAGADGTIQIWKVG